MFASIAIDWKSPGKIVDRAERCACLQYGPVPDDPCDNGTYSLANEGLKTRHCCLHNDEHESRY
jgi:hypothetical protein